MTPNEWLNRPNIAGLVERLRKWGVEAKRRDTLLLINEAADALEMLNNLAGVQVAQSFYRDLCEANVELAAAKVGGEWQSIETAPKEIDRTIVVAYKAGPHWIKRLAFWHPENGWTDVTAGTIYRNVERWRPLFDDPPLAAQGQDEWEREEDGSNDDRASNLHSRSGDVHIPTHSVTTDIAGLVERLRHDKVDETYPIYSRMSEAADALERTQHLYAQTRAFLGVAQDELTATKAEIERLEIVAKIHYDNNVPLEKLNNKLGAENKRLREDKATVTRIMNERNQTVIDLRAENERLRNALGKEQR